MARSIASLAFALLVAGHGAARAEEQGADAKPWDQPAYLTRGDTVKVTEQEAADGLKRIAELDDAGPRLNAVIVFNPDAARLARAAAMAGLPLAGEPVLVKDNIETKEWPTTAGSLALKDNQTGRDAPLIARLRAAGGVVLGKTNLSEWANIRSSFSTSGWSAVGGLVKNPYATDRNACGSSSGQRGGGSRRASPGRRSGPRPTDRSPAPPQSTGSWA